MTVVMEGGSDVAKVVSAGLPPQAVATSKISAPINKSAPVTPRFGFGLVVLDI